MTLTEAAAHLGRRAVYQPPGGGREFGTIASVTPRWVYVRYDGQDTAKATDPALLTLAATSRPGPPPLGSEERELWRGQAGE